MKQEKIVGFFGGTFDPIHFGHINLVLEIKEKQGLDEVLFCPAALSPHKLQKPPFASAAERLTLVQLAISDIPGFSVTDLEINRGGISYTIDTLRALYQQKTEKVQLRLIIAQDSIQHFSQWREYKEILNIAPPLIGIRADFPTELPDFLKKNLVKTNKMEIDGTRIRERLKKGLYCGHLLPAKVLDYIYKHQLYCSQINGF